MQPPKKSGPPRRAGPGGPKRPGGPDRPAGPNATGGRGRGDRVRFTTAAEAKADGVRPDKRSVTKTDRDGARAAPPRSDAPRPAGPRPAAPRSDAPKPYVRKPRFKKPGTTSSTPANPHPARAAASAEGRGEPQRIAKLLARAGVASRREVERIIEEGRVTLNGVAVETPATLLVSLQGVAVDDVAIGAPAPTRLFMFHKPSGYLTAERDPEGRPTIYDRLPDDLPRVIPIGRLDMTTEGLLLLTTDGGFKRQMELPATGVPRTYRARAFGEVSQQQLEDLFDGIEIEGIRYGPIEANLERRTGRNQWIEMTLTEGKNREVRRVLEHMGLQVNRLIRTSYGPFALGDLAPGKVEEVRPHDLDAFRASLKSAK